MNNNDIRTLQRFFNSNDTNVRNVNIFGHADEFTFNQNAKVRLNNDTLIVSDDNGFKWFWLKSLEHILTLTDKQIDITVGQNKAHFYSIRIDL